MHTVSIEDMLFFVTVLYEIQTQASSDTIHSAFLSRNATSRATR